MKTEFKKVKSPRTDIKITDRATGKEIALRDPKIKNLVSDLVRKNTAAIPVIEEAEVTKHYRPFGAIPITAIKLGGTTKERPKDAKDEDLYYDTTLNIPIRFNGTNWLDQNDSAV